MLNNPDHYNEMQMRLYRNFLTQTAQSLGVNVEELAKIDGFSNPDQINEFIDYLVGKYGVKREVITPFFTPTPKEHLPYLRQGEVYNEWELP